MSSITRDNENHGGHLAYAPKRVRDAGFKGSPGIAEGEFPQHDAQSYPVESLEDREEGNELPSLDLSHLRRARDPEIAMERWRARRTFRRRAYWGSLAVAGALAGATVLLAITETSPGDGNKPTGF